MSAHEARAATLLFRILENGHVKPDVHEQVWFAEAKRLLETEPISAVSPTSEDDACPDCGRSRFPVDRCNPDEIDDDGECPYLTIARLRSQSAEREALLARGAELIEQDLKELERLRVELWKFNRPHGYDVNGRTYSDTFGLCSHGVILIRECEQCNAGSGRPRAAIDEDKTSGR